MSNLNIENGMFESTYHIPHLFLLTVHPQLVIPVTVWQLKQNKNQHKLFVCGYFFSVK